MARIGVNTFLWTTTWEGDAAALLGRIKRLGFDAVQIPLLRPGLFDPREMRRMTEDLGLVCYLSAGIKDDMDVTSDDPQVRRRGVEFLKECVRAAAMVGSPFLSGSFHSVFGKKARGPVERRQWEHSAECLKEVAEEAGRHGLDLVLEPINRYESFLVNTAAQARELIAMTGARNIRIQLDTFHMNLEEEDFYETIRSVGRNLAHFHVAENHRGRFRHGMLPWEDVFKGLANINYRGAIVIESFVPEVTEVATAACIWRKMAPSADALAQEGLAFIREMADRHNL